MYLKICLSFNFFQPSSIEILEYSSDSEKEDDLENVLLIDSESPHKYHVEFESDARQIVERLIDPKTKSTETILHTPQKPTAKFPRTPEKSAKKLLRLNYTLLNTLFKFFSFFKNPNI